jgi:uncharacterized protein
VTTVLITGGTGLIGQALTALLIQRGYKVIILTRKQPGRKGPAKTPDALQYAVWDVPSHSFPGEILRDTDYIIHLAGTNVGKGRWTARRKADILHSRTDSGLLITEALRRNPNRVKAVISASGIGWYGPDGDRPFRESDPPAEDFLGSVCREWEAAISGVLPLGKRLVILRTGIVLARTAGAFPAFRAPLRAGIGAILGSGKQVISWIHLQDLCRMYLQAIEDHSMQGAYNAAAPGPVTNKAFNLALAKAVRGQFFIPIHVPAFLLRMVLGEMSVEVLKSCTVENKKILLSGFLFDFPTLDGALTELTR